MQFNEGDEEDLGKTLGYFCSKCAIALASQGYKIQELKLNEN